VYRFPENRAQKLFMNLCEAVIGIYALLLRAADAFLP